MSSSPWSDLDDRRLLERTARRIGVPREAVPADRVSFVLHAPLELLARAALLPYVAPRRREAARARIAALGDTFEASAPPRPPSAARSFSTAGDAAAWLTSAVTAGDRDGADAAATWLGEHCRPGELTPLLADAVLPSLEAAGHGNIYLALLARTQPRGLPGQMLRHVVDAVVAVSPRTIALPPVRVDSADRALHRLLASVAGTAPVGAPDSDFIAPLVEHAQRRGSMDRLLEDDGWFVAPAQPPFPLLRFAAQSMLQGRDDQVPYGWTHCLTLAQAPLLMVGAGADLGRATFVAAAYLVAHWAGHGEGHVDLGHVPDPAGGPLQEALSASPEVAAGVAWHTPDPAAVASVLATAASVNHDAHRVKYTLACLDAAACDPAAARLHLAAAAHLNAWWEQHPDAGDPSPELAATPAVAIAG